MLGPDDQNAYLSFRNLPSVQVMKSSELNAYDVLCSDWVVFTQATLPTGQADVVQASTEPAAAEPTSTEED